MIRMRVIVVPCFAVTVAVVALVGIAMRLKDQTRDAYSLPVDRSPQTLLRFIRKLEGKIDNQQSLWGTSNILPVSKAILDAALQLRSGDLDLTDDEQREVAFYRVKYRGISLVMDHEPPSAEELGAFIDESRQYLAASESFSRREQDVSEIVLRVSDAIGSSNEGLSFCDWLLQTLATKRAKGVNETMDSFLARLTRIQSRYQLVSQVIELESRALSELPFDIASLKGKVTLIEFWGTRCQPCIRDIPALRQIYQTYRSRGFEIVGICLNSEPERIRSSAGEHGLPWIQLCHHPTHGADCNLELMQRFGIEAVPTTFLLDHDLRVIAQDVRPFAFRPEKDLEKCLKQLLP